MAIAKTIRNWTCIVPVRFARAPHATNPNTDTGPTHPDAPDPDDRGFFPVADGCAVLPVGLDETLAEAAVPETRVRLLRVNMENAGQLFVTVDNAARLTLTDPAGANPLPSQHRTLIKFRARSVGDAFLEIRFGARSGPIIHRLRVTINGLLDVQVRAHVPQINGAAVNNPAAAPPGPVPNRSVRTDAQIRAMITAANQAYFCHGIRFVINGAVDRAGVRNFVSQGFVNDMTGEFGQMMATNRANNMINIYFVPQIGSAAEINSVHGSATSARRNAATFGSLISDQAATAGHVIAHELGHVLNLINDPRGSFIHADAVRQGGPAGTGRRVRHDILTRRRLMFSTVGFPANGGMAYRDNVGYGANINGDLLAVKQLNADRTDQEAQEVRNTAGRI